MLHCITFAIAAIACVGVTIFENVWIEALILTASLVAANLCGFIEGHSFGRRAP